LNAIARCLASISFALVVIAGFGAVITMVVVTADVVLRFFGGGIPGTLELVTYYLMSMVVFLPLARVERLEQTITVDVFTGVMSNRVQLWLGFLVALLSAAIYGTICYLTALDAGVKFAAGSYILTDRFPLPIWPAYFVVPVAFLLATLTCLLRGLELALGTYRPRGGEIIEDMGLQLADGGANREQVRT